MDKEIKVQSAAVLTDSTTTQADLTAMKNGSRVTTANTATTTDSKTPTDFQARAYQLTINNAQEHGFDHTEIKKLTGSFKTNDYSCLCDEIGESGTHHTHIYLHFKTPVRFDRIKKLFSPAHIEKALGTAEDNRNYVRKEGKWADDKKKETNLPETFEEWGTMPTSHQGERTDLTEMVDMVKAGYSNKEIIEANPNLVRYLSHMDRVRYEFISDKFKNEYRKIECVYVYGKARTGKTRKYMEKYGYENVCRISNYDNPRAIWDSYNCEKMVIFDEYRSQCSISSIMIWLEGYPNKTLSARYWGKVACYTEFIIISNDPLESQYTNVQQNQPDTWEAFVARINKVVHFKSATEIIEYNSVYEYLHRDEQFHEVDSDTKLPFE